MQSTSPLLTSSNGTSLNNSGTNSKVSHRSRQFIIGLLVTVLCCQLYLMRIWWHSSTTGGMSHQDETSSRELERIKMNSVRCNPLSAADPPTHENVQIAMQVLRRYIGASQLISTANAIAPPPPSSNTTSSSKLRTKSLPDRPRLFNDSNVHIKLGEHKHGSEGGHGHGHSHNTKGSKSSAEAVHAHEGEKHAHSKEFLQAHPTIYQQLRLNYSAAWAHDVLRPFAHHSLTPEDKKRKQQCIDWYEAYPDMVVDSSWMSFPKEHQDAFDKMGCSEVVSVYVTAKFVQENPTMYNTVWGAVNYPADRIRPKPTAPNTNKDVIAIIHTVTTRGLVKKGLTKQNIYTHMELFKSLFPSLLKTAEVGFEYWCYLGYDEGDEILDDEETIEQIQEWFTKHISSPARVNGIIIKLVPVTWNNTWRRPGPAFNYVCGVAYADGAEWIYRINDDIQFHTPWAKALTGALLEMGAPYGVVGPQCHNSSPRMLVIDFVHRTHHDIFPQHYPPALLSWYMDDWVTLAYGRQRTKRLHHISITHITSTHGTRYDGMWSDSQYLRGELARTNGLLELYMSHTPNMEKQLAAWKIDSARGKYELHKSR